MIFTKRKIENVRNIQLDNKILPKVSSAKYLGSILQSDNSMELDMGQKRGSFISLVNSLLQEFYFASPNVLMKLIISYGTAFYGSTAWDLFSNGADRIYKA